MNKQEIIDAAMEIASGVGTDAHESPIADADMAAENLLPLVFRHVYTNLLRENPDRFQDLLRPHDITLTAGKGPLPDEVMTDYLDRAFLKEFPYSSRAQYRDYDRQVFDNLLCYWRINDRTLETTCQDTGTITLYAVTVPVLPTPANLDVDIAPRDLNAVIYALALALRGELKLVQ